MELVRRQKSTRELICSPILSVNGVSVSVQIHRLILDAPQGINGDHKDVNIGISSSQQYVIRRID
jgi:hypothetical protein